jgi:hypothetical protein
MIFPFYLSPHQRAWCVIFFFAVHYLTRFSSSVWKQKQRQVKIDSLPPSYFARPSPAEQKIYALSLSQLVSQCKSGVLSPSSIMLAYAKKTISAHQATNCLSDIMFNEALATPSFANWSPGLDSDATNDTLLRERPLMGVPVSIKGT